MQIETIAIIRTSELNPQQMEAIRDVTYPADHEGDYWMVDVTILRDADAPLADEMVQANVKSALIIDDVNSLAEQEDLKVGEELPAVAEA